MEKLIDLLKRWAELEPERCEVPPKELNEGIFSNPDFTIYGNEYSTFWYSDDNVEEAEVLIQGAVQQAIRARGWYFVIQPSPSQYEVVVYKSLTEGSDHYFISSDIAEALLAAYLQAIEATAKVPS